jgi:hypothetical protein
MGPWGGVTAVSGSPGAALLPLISSCVKKASNYCNASHVINSALNEAAGSDSTGTLLSQIHLAYGKEMVSARRWDGFESVRE